VPTLHAVLTLHAAVAISAALAAAYLLLASPTKLWPLLALLAAGVQVARAQAWLRVGLSAPTLDLTLGVALLVPGLVIWWRAGGKGPLTAASVLAFIGLVQTALAGLARL
jgi:hypothetical protein